MPYPWNPGDRLNAADLNAAVVAARGSDVDVPWLNPADDDFTVVILPDTQRMVAHLPNTWLAIPDWIAANKVTHNIKAVISLGDVVDDATVAGEFVVAKQGWDVLLGTGIPSFIGTGNHDYDTATIGASRPFTLFPATFPLSYMSSKPWYGGAYGSTVENWWGTFRSASTTYLVLMLECFPRDAVLAWAQHIMDTHHNVPTLLMCHSHISANGTRTGAGDLWGASTYGCGPPNGNDANAVWNNFIKLNQQIFIVFSGHQIPTPAIAYFPDLSDAGTVVHQLLFNHQDDQTPVLWGTGNIGLLRFRPGVGVIEMTDYSVGTDSLYAPGAFTFAKTLTDSRITGDADVFGDLTVAGQGYFGRTPVTPPIAQLEATDPDSTMISHLRLNARFNFIGRVNFNITNGAKYRNDAWLHEVTSTATRFAMNEDNSFTFYNAVSAAAGAAVVWEEQLRISPTGQLQIALVGTGDYVRLNNRFHLIGLTNFNLVNNASYDGSAWHYESAAAAQYISIVNDGSFRFFNAPVGVAAAAVTWTQTFGIGAAGELLTTPKTPASAAAAGVAGTICADTDYIYVCVSSGAWKRVAIATW